MDTQESPRRRIVITGATGGIGSACAHRFASGGDDLALVYRSNNSRAATLAGELSDRADVSTWAADLASSTDLAQTVDAIVARHGRIDGVIHAAGPLVEMVHLSRVEPATYVDHLMAEAASFFNVVHTVLPSLRESRGNVVAVTTVATDRYPVRDGLSAGTKGAVEQLVRAYALEEGRYGVRFNSVGPAILGDGMVQKLRASGDLGDDDMAEVMRRTPMRRLGSTADIANAAYFLASAEAGWITGQKLNVDGGYSI